MHMAGERFSCCGGTGRNSSRSLSSETEELKRVYLLCFPVWFELERPDTSGHQVEMSEHTRAYTRASLLIGETILLTGEQSWGAVVLQGPW